MTSVLVSNVSCLIHYNLNIASGMRKMMSWCPWLFLDELVDCVEFNCTLVEDNNCTSAWGCNFTEYDYVGLLQADYNDEDLGQEETATKITAAATKVFMPKTSTTKQAIRTTTVAGTTAPTTTSSNDDVGNLEKEEEDEKTSSARKRASTSKVLLFFVVILAFAFN